MPSRDRVDREAARPKQRLLEWVSVEAIRARVDNCGRSRYWVEQQLDKRGNRGAKQRLKALLAGTQPRVRRDFLQTLAQVLKVEWHDLKRDAALPDLSRIAAVVGAMRLRKDLSRRGKRRFPISTPMLEALLSLDLFYFYFVNSKLAPDDERRGEWRTQFAKGVEIALQALFGAWMTGDCTIERTAVRQVERALRYLDEYGTRRLRWTPQMRKDLKETVKEEQTGLTDGSSAIGQRAGLDDYLRQRDARWDAKFRRQPLPTSGPAKKVRKNAKRTRRPQRPDLQTGGNAP